MSFRNFRRRDTELSTSTTLVTRAVERTSTDVTLATPSVTDDGSNDSKGPLGLNLLHSPAEPLVDFVFVHGLGGGSKKTWSKTSSAAHYWPQEWLPEDHAFKNVRVHSFGYNSDWAAGKENCLNIYHFGKSLLGEMKTSPYMGNSDTPIVLIGHSMGGVVIKKAYLLAKQDTAYDDLVERFHSLFFLATPHKGSDSAKLLNGILQIAYSSRAYVADLDRRSGAIQSINDEFRKYSTDLDLWSFYETEKLNVGVFSALIVDPDSATLGYSEEKQIPLDADHRSICKFESRSDRNYIKIRNSLASTVNGTLKRVLRSKEKLRKSQMRELEKYLGVSKDLENDFANVEDVRMSGTCEWLLAKQNFVAWKDFSRDTPGVLWVTGKPASGKSVLAGFAISQLEKMNANCSSFFFKHGEKSKSRLSVCLRSLAFQMASTNAQIRETLLEMQKSDITFDNDNERSIWRNLFLSGIFQTETSRHYWVIDALDECVNFTSFFDSMLAKLDVSIPLRILITSRKTPELEKNFLNLGTHRYQSEEISVADTLPDIKLLVESKAKSLLAKEVEDGVSLIERILEKSKGSFLWTTLVLNELSNSYSEEEISQVLDDVPRGMEPLYQRTLDLMSHATRGKKLAKAILIWAACTTRPLTTKELEGALKLDVQENILKIEEIVEALCGQLVTIDKFGKVQMVHETAREFLLSEELKSEFAVNEAYAHTRIAKVCLTYLTGDEMKPPRSSRRRQATIAAGRRAKFSAYACTALSYHLARADPLADDVLTLVDKFLKSNVLSWIEVIARTRDLIPLVRTAKNLKTYLNTCTAERSPLGAELSTIRGWTVDLTRIAAKFADALITSPSAIYTLIVPFCPTESTIYKTTNAGRKLMVVGLSHVGWDDRLSCIEFYKGQTSAICHGYEFFAVGLTTGRIALYHSTSCQEYKFLDHGEAVKFLQFRSNTDFMASCGMRTIRIWDIRSGEIIHTFQAPPRPIGLAFDKNVLIAASNKNYLSSWDLDSDGLMLPNRPWNDSSEHSNAPSPHQPCAISISLSHNMLAVAYSGRPITLWDLEEDAYYGGCGRKLSCGGTSTHMVTALVFNPNPAIGLLVASYLDGQMVLFDPFDDQDLESTRANCHTLAASPDGRLLAGAAGSGVVQIYEFETLRLLYRVKSASLYIKQLAFSKDSLHFADIRGSQCNVWDPIALLRDAESDDSSEDTSTSLVEMVSANSKVKISTMLLHPKGGFVFCGKDNGSVSLYDLEAGTFVRTLYQHKSLVRILGYWPQRDIMMSVDVSNGVFLEKLGISDKEGWVVKHTLLQSRLDCGKSIIQVLPGEEVGKFILSTRESDHLWTIGGQQEDERTYAGKRGIRKWLQHPQSSLHMISVETTAVRIYDWNDWSEVKSISLTVQTAGLQLKNIVPFDSNSGWRTLIELSEQDGTANTCGLQLFETESSIEKGSPSRVVSEAARLGNAQDTVSITTEVADIMTTTSQPLFEPELTALAHNVVHIIGLINPATLIFLDTYSWVCSIELETLRRNSVSYSRHFFVPYEWFSGIREVVCAVSQRDILFARNDDVAIIKGGLEYTQKVHVEVESNGADSSSSTTPVKRWF